MRLRPLVASLNVAEQFFLKRRRKKKKKKIIKNNKIKKLTMIRKLMLKGYSDNMHQCDWQKRLKKKSSKKARLPFSPSALPHKKVTYRLMDAHLKVTLVR
jgi:hypothetical protein